MQWNFDEKRQADDIKVNKGIFVLNLSSLRQINEETCSSALFPQIEQPRLIF